MKEVQPINAAQLKVFQDRIGEQGNNRQTMPLGARTISIGGAVPIAETVTEVESGTTTEGAGAGDAETGAGDA